MSSGWPRLTRRFVAASANHYAVNTGNLKSRRSTFTTRIAQMCRYLSLFMAALGRPDLQRTTFPQQSCSSMQAPTTSLSILSPSGHLRAIWARIIPPPLFRYRFCHSWRSDPASEEMQDAPRFIDYALYNPRTHVALLRWPALDNMAPRLYLL
jgi:hypothetical protein